MEVVTGVLYGRDDHIVLPTLKNSHLADDSFAPLGLCTTMPSSLDLFFSGSRRKQALAKKLCWECSVTQECSNYAITTEQEFGVWGGQDEQERKSIIKTQQGAA